MLAFGLNDYLNPCAKPTFQHSSGGRFVGTISKNDVYIIGESYDDLPGVLVRFGNEHSAYWTCLLSQLTHEYLLAASKSGHVVLDYRVQLVAELINNKLITCKLTVC